MTATLAAENAICAVAAPISARNDPVLITDPDGGSFVSM
jgi:hypothetical protein